MTSTIKVSTIDGLYDEKSEALTCNVSGRRDAWRCLVSPHKWVNASLHFERENFSINLKCTKSDPPAWGESYGGIRFCRRCKLIDCIHLWGEEKHYEVESGKFYSTHHEVATCRICLKRILRGGWGQPKPDPEAWEVMNQVCKELGKAPVRADGGYGSGWICELPVAISQILDEQGRDSALDYARTIFRSGDCSPAMAIYK